MRIHFVKQGVFLFLITLNLLLVSGICLAEDITVELIWKFSEPKWLEIEIQQGVYELEYNKSKLNLEANESFIIGQSGLTEFLWKDNRLTFLDELGIRISTSDKGIFRLREPGEDWVSYRGDLGILKVGMHWKLYTTLDSEDYLKGVVPIEMSNAWAAKGFQALKAQAVAARTYLLKNINSQARITDSPDIHQAYLGRTVEGEASQAVEETRGEILVDIDNAQPILIFYSSHNGGYSEETQNVWQNHDPHYSSEPDQFSQGIGDYVDNWRFSIAADILGKNFGLAPIREIYLKKYPSGRVYEVRLLDWLGSENSVSGGEFVQAFYPYNRSISKDSFLGRLFQADYVFPSITDTDKLKLGLFPVSNQQTVGPVLSRLKSSNEGLADKPRQFGMFVFRGRGWGHGVGMSQWGAYNMSMQGYSYEEILAYYYKRSIIKKNNNN
jgi:stage II sporulation protein D